MEDSHFGGICSKWVLQPPPRIWWNMILDLRKWNSVVVFLGGSSIDSIEVEAVGLRNGCYDKKELSWLFLGPAKMETRCYSASGS